MSVLVSTLAILMVIASTGNTPASGQPETPRYGGTLMKSDLYGDPRTLDPLLVSRLGATMVAMHIFDGLVKLDGQRGVVVPDIAARWTISPDGKTYTFYLRKGVLFHDGTEVIAADFKYQLERVANPENLSPNMPRLAGVVGLKEFQEKRAGQIEGIKAPDRYTLQISLTRPNALLPYYLSGVWASAVPRRAVERLGQNFAATPVGSGPFVFESWQRDSRLILRRFDKYWRTDKWGNKLPYIDKVVFLITGEMATVEAEFEAGNLDFTVVLDPQYRKYRNHPLYGKFVVEVTELYTRHIGFNMEMTGVPWQDRRVRLAMNHAIDSHAIANVVNHGKAYPATGVLPPTMPGYNRTLNGYEYDLDKAKRLLTEAGYPNGLKLKMPYRNIGSDPAIAQTIQASLKKAGFEIELSPVPPADFYPRLITNFTNAQNGVWDMVPAGWSPDWPGGAAGSIFQPQYSYNGTHGTFNFSDYNSDKANELAAKASATTDPAESVKLWEQVDETVMADAPTVPLVAVYTLLYHGPAVQNFLPYAPGGQGDWTNVWLSR